MCRERQALSPDTPLSTVNSKGGVSKNNFPKIRSKLFKNNKFANNVILIYRERNFVLSDLQPYYQQHFAIASCRKKFEYSAKSLKHQKFASIILVYRESQTFHLRCLLPFTRNNERGVRKNSKFSPQILSKTFENYFFQN